MYHMCTYMYMYIYTDISKTITASNKCMDITASSICMNVTSSDILVLVLVRGFVVRLADTGAQVVVGSASSPCLKPCGTPLFPTSLRAGFLTRFLIWLSQPLAPLPRLSVAI